MLSKRVRSTRKNTSNFGEINRIQLATLVTLLLNCRVNIENLQFTVVVSANKKISLKRTSQSSDKKTSCGVIKIVLLKKIVTQILLSIS